MRATPAIANTKVCTVMPNQLQNLQGWEKVSPGVDLRGGELSSDPREIGQNAYVVK